MLSRSLLRTSRRVLRLTAQPVTAAPSVQPPRVLRMVDTPRRSSRSATTTAAAAAVVVAEAASSAEVAAKTAVPESKSPKKKKDAAPKTKKAASGKRKAEATEDAADAAAAQPSEALLAAADALADAQPSTSAPKAKRAKSSAKAAAEGEAAPRHPSAPIGNFHHDTLAPEHLPRNVDVPATLEYVKPAEGRTRISAWNIVSLNSSEKKGLMRYLHAEDAHVVVLSETKVADAPMHPALARWPHQYWGISPKKGQQGVALLSKTKPIATSFGLPSMKAETRGRAVTAEFENWIVVGTYCVNAGEGLKTLPEKQLWNAALAEHLAECDSRKPVIWCGDFNVVMDHRDLAGASKKWNKAAGYTEVECEHHRKFLAGETTPNAKPFVDVWRQKHPDAVGHYTFHGFRGFCRSKGMGWRLDSFIVSQRAAEKVKECEIRHEVYGASDHVPIYADVEW